MYALSRTGLLSIKRQPRRQLAIDGKGNGARALPQLVSPAMPILQGVRRSPCLFPPEPNDSPLLSQVSGDVGRCS